MAAWESRVGRMLYEGEEVVMQVGDESVQVVLTTHRVHVFTPDLDGANYRVVDRPNVRGVSTGTSGRTGWLVGGGKALVVGAVLLVGGLLVDFDGLFANVEVGGGAGQVGGGQIIGMVGLLQSVLAMLDELLLWSGGLALLVGLVAAGGYYLSRDPVVTIEVAGDEDIEVPADRISQSDRSKLIGMVGSG